MTTLDANTSRPPTASTEVTSLWPDGWYLYENGKLNGPLSADEAFAHPAQSEDGSPRLVSRKGFTQWYPIQDFAQLYRLSESMGKKLEMATAEVEPTSTRTVVQGKKVGPTTISPKSRSTLSETSALRQAVAAATASPSSAPASAVPVPIAKAAVLQEYFLARSRLGLGQLRNAWAVGFGGWPLSLGSYWVFWFVSICKEIEHHTQNAVPAPKWLHFSAVVSALPVVNLWTVYRLACQIREMEKQNKYTYINPGLAMLTAFLPPVALFYVQGALNRHWLLHAKHLILKRRAEAAAAATGAAKD